MKYARIDLTKTNYDRMHHSRTRFLHESIDIDYMSNLYKKYCQYKKFKSVMPIFDSEYSDEKNHIHGYYDPNNNKLIAFSLIRVYDPKNVEAIQFAWDYENPELLLGIESLKNECAFYKEAGFKYYYLGGADEYKKQFDGFEILGPA
jgi:hypothetical protein